MQELAGLSSATNEISYGQLVSILWRRKRCLGVAIAGSLFLSGLYTLIAGPKFESKMQLLVQPNVVEPNINLNELAASGGTFTSSTDIELDYTTQINLMRSSPLIEETLTQFLDEFPDYCDGVDIWQDCVEEFEESLTLIRLEEDGRDTRIFETIFTGNSKSSARRALQILQDIYLEYNLSEQEKRLTEGLDLVDRQIVEVRANLDRAQEELKQLRQSEGAVNPTERSTALSESLDEVLKVRQVVESDYQASLARRAAILEFLNIEPDIAILAAQASQSGRYQNLLDSLQAIELSLAESEVVYSQSNPIVLTLREQRDQYLSVLQKELQRLDAQDDFGTGNTADLLALGQLVETDVALVDEMVKAQLDVSSLEARLDTLVRSEQRLKEQLNRFVGLIDEYDRLQLEVLTLSESLEQLLENRQELSNELAQGGFKWIVVEPPSVAERVADPIINLALGAIAGLFGGVLLAYGLEAFDHSIVTVQHLQSQADLPILGSLPERKLDAVDSNSWSKFLRLNTPSIEKDLQYSELANSETFRDYFAILFKTLQLSVGSMKSLVITSAIAGEGKTTLAVGLAISAARSRNRVLLVDTNLRSPSLHKIFDLPNTGGLYQGLTSSEPTLPERISVDGVELDVMVAGSVSEDSEYLLSSERMLEQTAEFEKAYDIVIYDSSPVLGKVDVLQVASLCDKVVLVCRLGRITQIDLASTLNILSPFNCCGIVANGAPATLSTQMFLTSGKTRSLTSAGNIAAEILGIERSSLSNRSDPNPPKT